MSKFSNLYYTIYNKLLVFSTNNLTIESDVRINKSIIKKKGILIIREKSRIGPYVILSPSNGKITIGKNTSINAFSMIYGPGNVKIGKNVSIAPRCSLMAFNHNFNDIEIPIKKQGVSYKGITVEDNVWIGNGVTVLDGVVIGSGSVIGAGSIVTKSIPKNSIAVGNPCKVIKSRKIN